VEEDVAPPRTSGQYTSATEETMHTRAQPPLVRSTLAFGLGATVLAGCHSWDTGTPLVEPSRDVLATPASADLVAGRLLARHVLLLSIDGLHATDLMRFIAASGGCRQSRAVFRHQSWC
jgi:hypothetical protein